MKKILLSSVGALLAFVVVSNAQAYDTHNTMTIGEFVKEVVRQNGGIIMDHSDADGFDDVDDSHPKFGYLYEAAEEDWYLGNSDCYGSHPCYAFPNETISRQLAAHIAIEAFGLTRQYKAPEANDAIDNMYSDSVLIAADNCSLLMDDGNIRPTDPFTEEDLADLLHALEHDKRFGTHCHDDTSAYDAWVKDAGDTWVKLETNRPLGNSEYYSGTCWPYTGREDSAFPLQRSTYVKIENLQPNTEYSCKMAIYLSPSGGTNQGSSKAVYVKTEGDDNNVHCCIRSNAGSWGTCYEKSADACVNAGGVAYDSAGTCSDACRSYTDEFEGYCHAPHITTFRSCYDRIERSDCEAVNGTFSEFKNTGVCANHGPHRDTVSCCKQFSNGGTACEEYPTTSSCEDWGGEVYSSCGACYDEATTKPPVKSVSCCKKFSDGGRACEEYPTTSSCENWGGEVYSSCGQCWEEMGAGPRPIPPAGYEDKVILADDYINYEKHFPDTNLATLEGVSAEELRRRAIIGGFPDGYFYGEQPVDRAQTAKFMIRTRYGDARTGLNAANLRDLKAGEWYYDYTLDAYHRGIIRGFPNSTFGPEKNVQRDQFVAMLARTFDLPLDLPHSYPDVTTADWSNEYVGIAEKYDLFPGETSFKPWLNMTRNEVSVALYQFLKNRDM